MLQDPLRGTLMGPPEDGTRAGGTDIEWLPGKTGLWGLTDIEPPG